MLRTRPAGGAGPFVTAAHGLAAHTTIRHFAAFGHRAQGPSALKNGTFVIPGAAPRVTPAPGRQPSGFKRPALPGQRAAADGHRRPRGPGLVLADEAPGRGSSRKGKPETQVTAYDPANTWEVVILMAGAVPTGARGIDLNPCYLGPDEFPRRRMPDPQAMTARRGRPTVPLR